jgi:succinate-semialdehyde dehydrogenase/glutarate-semialdehyde dehydrogenase
MRSYFVAGPKLAPRQAAERGLSGDRDRGLPVPARGDRRGRGDRPLVAGGRLAVGALQRRNAAGRRAGDLAVAEPCHYVVFDVLEANGDDPAAEYFRWFAEQARRPDGQVIPPELPDRRHLTIRRPTGVVASLTPWNFPCSIQARKLAPALAAGCTVVARVSEKAPLAVTEMIRCLTEAGLPAGVVNLVHGPARDLTQALLAHRAVRVVTFTGSTQVGHEIMASAARRIVRPLLELGGDAPFVVFGDADIDAAVEGALIAKFRNTGSPASPPTGSSCTSRCTRSSSAGSSKRVDAMTIGDGLADPCPDLGPLIDKGRAAELTGFVQEAVDAGAKVLTREFTLPSRGSYTAPALLADVPDRVRLACTEAFGPTAGIFRFRDEEEALARANGTEMGLAGYFWSRDVARCWRIAERLEAGIVGVNNALPSVAFAPWAGSSSPGWAVRAPSWASRSSRTCVTWRSACDRPVTGMDAVLLGLGVFAGASTQRVTGLGFALVSSPLLVLVAGPFNGVLLSNLLALAVSLVVRGLTWRHAQWRRVLLLALPAVALVPAGAWVARHLPAPMFLVLIGVLVVSALVAVVASDRARFLRGPGGAVTAGGLSGFMNATAGVGGPAIALRGQHRLGAPKLRRFAPAIPGDPEPGIDRRQGPPPAARHRVRRLVRRARPRSRGRPAHRAAGQPRPCPPRGGGARPRRRRGHRGQGHAGLVKEDS